LYTILEPPGFGESGDNFFHLSKRIIVTSSPETHCCPNLDQNGVLRCFNETSDTKVLLDGLEEQFDLPAFLVDLRDGRGTEAEMVREEDDALVYLGNPDRDTAKNMRASLPGPTPSRVINSSPRMFHGHGRHRLFNDSMKSVSLHTAADNCLSQAGEARLLSSDFGQV